MSSTHAQFVGSIPEKYDAHLGPLLFEYYAADLANRVAVADGGRVLETACGTGISTRALRAALPGGVRDRGHRPQRGHARIRGREKRRSR